MSEVPDWNAFDFPVKNKDKRFSFLKALLLCLLYIMKYTYEVTTIYLKYNDEES